MTDDLTQTAFRIADEASISLVQCNAQHIDAWTYSLTGEAMADEAMDEAVTYLVQRGLAHINEAGAGWRPICGCTTWASSPTASTPTSR